MSRDINEQVINHAILAALEDLGKLNVRPEISVLVEIVQPRVD